MDTETPRLVACGGDHAAVLRPAAHAHRLSAELRVVPLLHGCVERVHVEMEDLSNGRRHGDIVVNSGGLVQLNQVGLLSGPYDGDC